jgi:hypothetical protein
VLLSGGAGMLGTSNVPNISSGDLDERPEMKSLSNANISDYQLAVSSEDYLICPVLRLDLSSSGCH